MGAQIDEKEIRLYHAFHKTARVAGDIADYGHTSNDELAEAWWAIARYFQYELNEYERKKESME